MSTDSTEPTPAEIRREQRKGLIVSAAEEQLAEAGIAGTTLELVGRRVGLSKGALYYYVDSRDDLLALVLEDILGHIRERADEIIGGLGDASPIERLASFARAHVAVVVERPAGRLIVGNVDLLAAHERSAKMLHDHELVVRAIIDEASAAGELHNVNPVIASTVMFGALNTLCRTYNPGGALSLEEMVETALELLLGSWRVPSG